MYRNHSSLNIAILGVGYWGINYVRNFHELPHVTVAMVCDQRSERLDEVEHRFPGTPTSTDVADLLTPAIDAVVICTQAAAHFDVARQCLLADKHILVEKPMTVTAEESAELIAIARDRNVTLMVGHTFMFNSGVIAIQQLLDRNDTGRPYYLYARRTNLGPIRHDVNALWDLAPHDISIFNYWLHDVPTMVSATASHVLGSGTADVGFINLHYSNGVVGHIHVSWADPNKTREVVAVCANRRIVFDDTNALERVRVFEKGIIPSADNESDTFGEFQFQLRDGDIVSPKIPNSEPLKNQCRHFLNCIRTGNEPITDGVAGADVVRIMQAVDQSVALNGAPVPVPALNIPTLVKVN